MLAPLALSITARVAADRVVETAGVLDAAFAAVLSDRPPVVDGVAVPDDPVFDVAADRGAFEFVDPVSDVASGPVCAEFAELSPDGSAAARGVALLAIATPSPSATVAAAARVVSIVDFIKSPDR